MRTGTGRRLLGGYLHAAIQSGMTRFDRSYHSLRRVGNVGPQPTGKKAAKVRAPAAGVI